MEPFLFENVGQILNCILYCITAFKVEKNKELSEVAKGKGPKKYIKRWSLTTLNWFFIEEV